LRFFSGEWTAEPAIKMSGAKIISGTAVAK